MLYCIALYIVTGPECIRVDDASGQEVEADAGCAASKPCSDLRALVSAGEQVRCRQRCTDGLGLLLREGK